MPAIIYANLTIYTTIENLIGLVVIEILSFRQKARIYIIGQMKTMKLSTASIDEWKTIVRTSA